MNTPIFYQNTPTRSGKAPSNGLEIYFETFGNPSNPAIVLIMGLDAQCTLWSMAFIEPLVAAGYYILRFDNRDIGLSTWLNEWNRRKPYTLEDMAMDVLGLMDYLNIPKAHIIGASMGGMIAQRLAISHASRVKSLTSIMSSGYSLQVSLQPNLGTKLQAWIAPFVLRNFEIKNKYTHPKITVESYLRTYRYLAGTKYPFNESYFNQLFTHNIIERKGQNPNARLQQFSAIVASGSRLSELPKITVPSLVIHGTADKLVHPNHARVYAPLIPNMKMLWLEGMGHEIAHGFLPEIHLSILELLALSE
jgi:pimeloyl-ACP methyl ester carboxylesterase